MPSPACLTAASPPAPFTPCALQPWRLEVVREVHTQQASAKVQVSLRPGVAREAPELLLAGSESGTGERRTPEPSVCPAGTALLATLASLPLPSCIAHDPSPRPPLQSTFWM